MTGAFAHRLPAPRPTLVDLANAAILAKQVLRDVPDAKWNAANEADIAATEAFRAQLYAETGLSDDLIAQLQTAGVL